MSAQDGKYDPKLPLYKYFKPGMQSPHGSNLAWDLPKAGKPGQWKKVEGTLALCFRGLHASWNPRLYNVIGYKAARIFRVEVKGEIDKDDHKMCARGMRLLYEVKKGSDEYKWIEETQAKGWTGPFVPAPKPTVATVKKLTADLSKANDRIQYLEIKLRGAQKYLADIKI